MAREPTEPIVYVPKPKYVTSAEALAMLEGLRREIRGRGVYATHGAEHALGGLDPMALAGGPPSGPAGGDLGGSYPNPTVNPTHSGSAHHSAVTIGADAEHSLAGQVLSGVTATISQKGHAQFDSTAPAAVGTAAAGASGIIADRAHVHPTGAGTPSTQAFGDAAAVGTGPAAAMTDHKHAMPATPKVSHIIPFVGLAESAAVEVLLPRPGVCVGESGEHGTFAALRGKAICGTAGTGTNTILIEADDNPAFSTPTVLFTLNLGTTTEVDDTTLDNAWASTDIFVRARMTAVGGTAPKDLEVQFFFSEATF